MKDKTRQYKRTQWIRMVKTYIIHMFLSSHDRKCYISLQCFLLSVCYTLKLYSSTIIKLKTPNIYQYLQGGLDLC